MQLFDFDKTLNILPCNGEVYYFGVILDELDAIEAGLLENINWQADKLILYGKPVITKRKTAWFGDNAFHYSYSNTTHIASPWIPELLKIKAMVEEQTKYAFNSCLLNLYHSGNEGMSWHSDDEKELGTTPIIASISIGAERKFTFRHKASKKKVSVTLENGSLLLMKGVTQRHWQHCLPKSTKIKTPRINLTFRTILDN